MIRLSGINAVLLLLVLCVVLPGCRYQLSALRPPKFDPKAASKAAMDEYDANSDGKIDKSELKSAPGISSSLDRIDADGDGSVTGEEIGTMIQEKWIDAGAGIMRVAVEVTLNRKPLTGATVTFEPETFLGDVIHPATGETDDTGYCAMSMALEHMPDENNRSGVRPGLYLVRISKELNGKELIPAKYNSETTLGVEVAARASYMPGAATFELTK